MKFSYQKATQPTICTTCEAVVEEGWQFLADIFINVPPNAIPAFDDAS